MKRPLIKKEKDPNTRLRRTPLSSTPLIGTPLSIAPPRRRHKQADFGTSAVKNSSLGAQQRLSTGTSSSLNPRRTRDQARACVRELTKAMQSASVCSLNRWRLRAVEKVAMEAATVGDSDERRPNFRASSPRDPDPGRVLKGDPRLRSWPARRVPP